tara:strand:- start:126 stop:305 length:180 start_codon:yes stop_codon:yes gene_type:complete
MPARWQSQSQRSKPSAAAAARRRPGAQVGWHSIEAERGHSCQPTWQAKMRHGIASSAKS